MRQALAFLLLCVAGVLSAQSTVPIPADQCVWRNGDNLAWAATTLDESSWRSGSEWKQATYGTQVWVRCRVDPAGLRGVAHPAVQIIAVSAYELFFQGELIGRDGDLRSGIIHENNVRRFTIAGSLSAPGPMVLAMRHSFREPGEPFPQLTVGDAPALDAERARMIVEQVRPSLPYVIGYSILGVLGLVQLGLFLYDRSRRDLLLLSLVCIGLAVLRVNELCASALVDYSMRTRWVLFFVGNLIIIPQVCFFFALVGRRVPVYLRILLGVAMTGNALTAISMFLTADQAYWLVTHISRYYKFAGTPTYVLLVLAPFVALLSWSRVPRRLHLLAGLCLVWGASDFVYFVVQLTTIGFPGVPDLFAQWHYGLFLARAITQGAVLVALLSLLFHDYRIIVEERAQLAGELQSAREIQSMLAPAQIPTAPGLVIQVAFRPMREVGGDFYLCRVLADGTQRLLVGDVSGKGTAAAMTAALLLGGAEDNDRYSPGQLLTHLDRVLRESRVGGFATSLCADLATDGTVVLANAGHLPPYCRGEEIAVPASLPLGAAGESTASYEETRFHLEPGDTLTFLSDGVVEARSQSGELFGFERTRRLSVQPATEIAEAAQRFGQEDDITVLQLTLEGSAVCAH
jgi:hypothetical protein